MHPTVRLHFPAQIKLLYFFQQKLKKRQKESEHYMEVMMSNLILLRHLAEIAMSKRVEDGNTVS